jgi:hypothetical protein
MLREAGQRCLGLAPVEAADVTNDGATLELVITGADGRVAPSVLVVLAGTGIGILDVSPQGDALVATCA